MKNALKETCAFLVYPQMEPSICLGFGPQLYSCASGFKCLCHDVYFVYIYFTFCSLHLFSSCCLSKQWAKKSKFIISYSSWFSDLAIMDFQKCSPWAAVEFQSPLSSLQGTGTNLISFPVWKSWLALLGLYSRQWESVKLELTAPRLTLAFHFDALYFIDICLMTDCVEPICVHP